LPSPEVIRERARDDPRYLGPDALFRYERSVEPPTLDEGYTRVDERSFARRAAPNATNRAVILDFDDLLASQHDTLAQYVADGWLLFAHAWRPQVARGEMTLADVQEEFARVRTALGVEIALACCPHDAGPPICWCRKPLPGSVLEFALRHDVSLERSIILGHSAADRTMAQRLNTAFREKGSEQLF
jgi:hypothetical protein